MISAEKQTQIQTLFKLGGLFRFTYKEEKDFCFPVLSPAFINDNKLLCGYSFYDRKEVLPTYFDGKDFLVPDCGVCLSDLAWTRVLIAVQNIMNGTKQPDRPAGWVNFALLKEIYSGKKQIQTERYLRAAELTEEEESSRTAWFKKRARETFVTDDMLRAVIDLDSKYYSGRTSDCFFAWRKEDELSLISDDRKTLDVYKNIFEDAKKKQLKKLDFQYIAELCIRAAEYPVPVYFSEKFIDETLENNEKLEYMAAWNVIDDLVSIIEKDAGDKERIESNAEALWRFVCILCNIELRQEVLAF